jgi:hypothetical protein
MFCPIVSLRLGVAHSYHRLFSLLASFTILMIMAILLSFCYFIIGIPISTIVLIALSILFIPRIIGILILLFINFIRERK